MEKVAPTAHPVHELVARRWSPRAFAKRAVPKGELASLFEAARWAPSSMNEQPWSFFVATAEEPERHAQLVAILVPGNQVWAKDAPVLALAVARLTFSRNGNPNRHAWHDVGLATAQLVLEATARGLSVHQMAGFDPAKARETFGIPADHEPVAAMAIGYPGDPGTLPADLQARELAPRARRPLGETVFAGRWGQSAGL